MTSTRNRLYLLLALDCTEGYIWLFINLPNAESSPDVCMIKHVTGIPCPSCGSTRSITSLLHGDVTGSLFWNPMGILILLIMLIAPVWITGDVLLKKQTLFSFYRQFEKTLQQRRVAIPAIALVVLNWIWNIHKGL